MCTRAHLDYKLPQPERKVVSTLENFTEHRKLENAHFLTGPRPRTAAGQDRLAIVVDMNRLQPSCSQLLT